MKNDTSKLFQVNIYFNLADVEDQLELEAKNIEKQFKVKVTEVDEDTVRLIGEKPALLAFLRAFDLSQMSPGEDESDWKRAIKPYTGR